MARNALPDDVVRFLTHHVSSTLDLGVLLMLMTASDRWWNVGAASDHVGVSEARLRPILEAFASRNLLEIKLAGDVLYRFRPGNATLERRAKRVLELYEEQPEALMRWATRFGRVNASAFADAFRLKR